MNRATFLNALRAPAFLSLNLSRIFLTALAGPCVFVLAPIPVLQANPSTDSPTTNSPDVHRKQASIAGRGQIRDRNGNLLAQTKATWNIVADCSILSEGDAPAVLNQLGAALQIPASAFPRTYLASRLVESGNPATGTTERINNRHLILARNITADAMNAFSAQKWTGIYSEPAALRVYPENEVAAHLIGFTDQTGRGVAGVEKEMDQFLAGAPGTIGTDRGVATSAVQTKKDQNPQGCNVTLTIDLAIQRVVDDQLDQIVQQYAPITASIIVMDPSTGEILGMASRPTYDPNHRSEFRPENLRNRCLTDGIEPGSLFEIIPLAGALNEGLLNLDTSIFCENGVFNGPGHGLRDGEPHGWLPVEEVMAQSSNIGFAKIGLNYLHPQKLYQYASAFGMGQRTGIFGDQGEMPGIIWPVAKWSALSVTRFPIGQEVVASPLQLVSAMSVIANGGKLMAPFLVGQVTDDSGRVVMDFHPRMVRQVINSGAAHDVALALHQVTVDGTAKAVTITGPGSSRYSFAGKPSTTQKFVDGAYSHTKHVETFAGFLPVENPKFVALVVIDEPHTEHDMGAQVAASAFAPLAGRVARILDIPPDH